MTKFSTYFNKVTSSGVSRFLIANMLYSLSTALISIMSPILLQNDVYEDFIYLFQMVLFLTGIFSAGLVPGLLRYYKFDNKKFEFYYYFTAFIIMLLLMIVGLFPGNFISEALKIAPDSIFDSLMIYLSIVFSLSFIFNRGTQTAKCNYDAILKDVLIIFVIRIVLLLGIKLFRISNTYTVLMLLCILPFIYEFGVFVLSFIRTKVSGLDKYGEFLNFIFKISIAGVIFTATSRLFIISAKSYDSSLAAALSFAAGMTGIITIFNTTFSSVFIGQLDHRDKGGVSHYIGKVKKFLLPFMVATLFLGLGIFIFVFFVYPDNTLQASIISAITVVHCAMMSYLGLITLMTKTYDLLNAQIFLNICAFLLVFIFVRYISVSINEYISYIIINTILLLIEILLAFFVLKHIRKYNSKLEVSE